MDIPVREHRDIALGANYWFSPNFVLKASYHTIEGNLWAIPDDPTAAADPDTRMWLVGTQFSF
jgi:hypothetical protein